MTRGETRHGMRPCARTLRWLAGAFVCIATTAAVARAQGTRQTTPPPAPKPTIEIYGFGQADAIVDFNQVNPQWFDVMRPSKLPSFANQFGQDQHFYLSARQSRFGAKGVLPTSDGDVTATFEFDLFGVGADAGQTTIRPRHMYGQWKQFGAGQTNSQFMDGDVFPNVLDYWGPNGMLFFRNVQVFWEPFNDGKSHARVSIENPGASGDGGQFADREELQNIVGRFPAPDLAGHYRFGRDWGYVQVGGMLRYIAYDDTLADAFDLSGHVWGGGGALSSNLALTPNNSLKLMGVWGKGIENYFNDAPIDVGVKLNPGNAVTPIVGEALPVLGLMAYLDHTWDSTLSSAIGYARVDVDNSDGQAPDAFHVGQYGSVNLLYTPVKNVMGGVELQWTRRENNSDGFAVNDFRVQFSFKFSFSAKLGGQ